MVKESIKVCKDLENNVQIPKLNLFKLDQNLKAPYKKNYQNLMWIATCSSL